MHENENCEHVLLISTSPLFEMVTLSTIWCHEGIANRKASISEVVAILGDSKVFTVSIFKDLGISCTALLDTKQADKFEIKIRGSKYILCDSTFAIVVMSSCLSLDICMKMRTVNGTTTVFEISGFSRISFGVCSAGNGCRKGIQPQGGITPCGCAITGVTSVTGSHRY